MRLGDRLSINIYLRQTQFPYSEICELRKRLILNIHTSGHLNKIELKISCINLYTIDVTKLMSKL